VPIPPNMRSLALPLRVVVSSWLAFAIILAGTSAAHARYGPQEEHLFMMSGSSGWLGESHTTLTRRVPAGHGVVFSFHARMHGMPGSSPVVVGCSSSHGVDVRYVWDRAERDVDITKAVADGGWRRPGQDQLDWRFRLRVSFRVEAGTPIGTRLDCPVRINIERRHAVIEVS
jgi:hypothetical protein